MSPAITAFLNSRGGDDDPKPLADNSDIAFSGYYNYGAGFLFDDSTEGASSLEEMQAVLNRDPRNHELIHPLVGGDDLLNAPSLQRIRFVIDFGVMSLEQAKKYPDLLDILERQVKPKRQKCKRERLQVNWWQFGEIRPGLRRESRGLERLLMIPFTAKHLAVGFVPGDFYITSPHAAITLDKWSAFTILQSRPHEIWARFFGSSLEDRLRYTPSDCFETFAFPEGWKTSAILEAVGKAYYEFRASLMVRNNEGLTKTYNRFNDPDERDPDLMKLRELHAAMDHAVLDAYGWSDIKTNCEFILDYEIDEEEWGDKKKPWRYRWPDEVRDEVLALLLELNDERAEKEARSGAAAKKRGKRADAKPAPTSPDTEDLFS